MIVNTLIALLLNVSHLHLYQVWGFWKLAIDQIIL